MCRRDPIPVSHSFFGLIGDRSRVSWRTVTSNGQTSRQPRTTSCPYSLVRNHAVRKPFLSRNSQSARKLSTWQSFLSLDRRYPRPTGAIPKPSHFSNAVISAAPSTLESVRTVCAYMPRRLARNRRYQSPNGSSEYPKSGAQKWNC